MFRVSRVSLGSGSKARCLPALPSGAGGTSAISSGCFRARLGLPYKNTDIKISVVNTAWRAVPRLLPFLTGVLRSFPSLPGMALCFSMA